MYAAEHPSMMLWVETTIAGLMQGMQRMVGTERFNLSMFGGGRESVEGDWALIQKAKSFEQGFVELAEIAVACGWGSWTLQSVSRDSKRAVFRIFNCWEALYQRALGVTWGSNFTSGKFAGLCSRLFGVNCWATQTQFQAQGAAYDEFEVYASDISLEDEHDKLLATDNATRADLAVALKRLEEENTERRRAEQEAQERLTMIETLSAPILEVWDGVLALPILGSLTAERSTELMERLLAEIQRTRSVFAILDLTGVDVVDTYTADHLLRMVRAVELLGTQCIITGIQPAVAQTMVNIQANFGDIVTRATLRGGLEYCMSRPRDL
nr:STAS domain-containing protein [Pseudenhygromyxa sp. WMMC2535]